MLVEVRVAAHHTPPFNTYTITINYHHNSSFDGYFCNQNLIDNVLTEGGINKTQYLAHVCKKVGKMQ